MSSPARRGVFWTAGEISQLLRSLRQKKSVEQIAAEHQRTVGAIHSYRDKLVCDYWLKEGKSVDEIMRLTGLSSNEIQEAIDRHTVRPSAPRVSAETKPAAANVITIDIGEYRIHIEPKGATQPQPQPQPAPKPAPQPAPKPAPKPLSRKEIQFETSMFTHLTNTLSNEYPTFHTKEFVLHQFISYIERYYSYCHNFDIPVGKKYTSYAPYIQTELKKRFPDITWSLGYSTDTKYVCRGTKPAPASKS